MPGMTVPTFTDASEQVKPTDLPSARVSPGAPAAAFGADSANIAQAGIGALKDATQVMQEQKDRADQLAHIQADTLASQKQTDIQMNVSKMKGQDALNAPDYAQAEWSTMSDKLMSQAVGNNQKLALQRTLAQRGDDLNKSVQMHVTSEMENFADQTYQSANDQARNSAVVNAGDDHMVKQNLDIQRQLMQGWAKRKGIPEKNEDGSDNPIYKDKLTAELSATHLGVIHQRLQSGLDDAAQKYYDDNKGNMTAKDIENAESALDGSKIIGTSSDLFQDITQDPKMKFSDGTMNGEAIRQKVMNADDLDGMSDQHKLRVLQQVKAMVGEYNRDRWHKISADERSFANEVTSARKNGVSLDDAMKIAHKWGYDQRDTAEKEAFVAGTYAPPKEEQAVAHEHLREGIESGTTELTDIDQARRQGQINDESWAGLRQQKLKTLADGTDPMMKATNARIGEMAKSTFGNDKDALAQFNYVLNKKTDGMSPDEKLKVAQDEMKQVPNPDSWFWRRLGMGKVPQSQLDAQQMEGQATAQGAMYSDIGYKQAQAVASGMQGGNTFQRVENPANHLQAFAQDLGITYDDLKVGTKYNNAIVSLKNHGKTVTPNAVRSVLKQYEDGNWK